MSASLPETISVLPEPPSVTVRWGKRLRMTCAARSAGTRVSGKTAVFCIDTRTVRPLRVQRNRSCEQTACSASSGVASLSERLTVP